MLVRSPRDFDDSCSAELVNSPGGDSNPARVIRVNDIASGRKRGGAHCRVSILLAYGRELSALDVFFHSIPNDPRGRDFLPLRHTSHDIIIL